MAGVHGGRAGCCRVDLPVVPLSLGVGLGLLAYGAYLRGQAPERRQATAAVPRTPLAARRTVVVIFVLVMLFWSVAVYAQARGSGRQPAWPRPSRGGPT